MPLPSPFLFPSPYLLPGGPGPFADLVLEAVSPWADVNGFWNNYNAALASMFEPAYDIVADIGDSSQTVIGSLSVQIDSTQPLTEIQVQAVSQTVLGGTEIIVSSGFTFQPLEVLTNTIPGATSILVKEVTPNFAYPVGTSVQLAFIPGWSTLLDPDNCPDQFLPFLAQFNGTDIPVGLDAATARTKIKGEGAQHRGTLTAIASAVKRNLFGSQSVVIQERIDVSGNANSYWFIVIVRPEEVVSVSALTADVNNIKPGGVQWTLIQTDGWIISQVEAFQATVTALEAQFVTITGLENDQTGT